ncbi:MAG: hypothetical protein OEU54_13285 [Gemmatimonadota bacterium]|nr:hypothetical protein [Gemmatimonadota bacterium]
MQNYEAYCAGCDANVRVTLDPDVEHPLESAKVECLDRCPSCDEVVCPLENATARELGERLEFLPSSAHEPDESAEVDPHPEETLRRARMQAMRRGDDPVR